MAEINFNELNLEKNIDTIPIQRKGMTIEIKQYLPIEEKAQVIDNIINQSINDDDFASPVRINIFIVLEIAQAYTNLIFSEEDRQNMLNIYDLLVSSGLWKEIYDNVPEDEYQFIIEAVYETIDEFYKYKNSILGILDTINTDYKDLELDATKISEKLANNEGVELLADVIKKMD